MQENEFNSFTDKSDEELCLLCSCNGSAASALISRYFKLILTLASRRCKNPSELDDLVSEAMISLVNAAQKYDSEKCDKFLPFAVFCIKNRLNTLTGSGKNAFSKVDEWDFNETEDVAQSSPEARIIESEQLQEKLMMAQNLLTAKEWLIFRLFLTGASYREIAEKSNGTVKSVDNAIQRVRKKLKTIWDTPDENE